MRSGFRLGLAGVLCASAATFVSVARAQDSGTDGGVDGSTVTPGAILAHYCGDTEMRCTTAPITFEKTESLLPISLDWDTGWIPQSFDELQVRFYLRVPDECTVKLAGDFKTTWPDALTVTTPGTRLSGLLSYDLGLEVGAKWRLDIDIGITHITADGDIPFVPQVDFHVLSAVQFDSWAFQPNPAVASGFTNTVKLFDINVLGLTGIPSEIAEGGVRLNLAGELKATYHTKLIKVVPSVVPISTENGSTVNPCDPVTGCGGYVEYDVHPEGEVSYDGIIHLIPAFYVEVFGLGDITMPIYDYPLSIADLIGQEFKEDFIFDPVRVHVPLPDIPQLESTEMDFGTVAVGSGEKLDVPIPNLGEGEARAAIEVETSMASAFNILSPVVLIDPGGSENVSVRFTPQQTGAYVATLTIRTNDPDLPVQTLEIRGQATQDGIPPYDGGTLPPADGAVPSGEAGEEPSAGGFDSGEDGGCGCRVDSRGESSQAWSLWALAGLVGIAAAGRSLRR